MIFTPMQFHLSYKYHASPFFLIINLAVGGEWGGQQGVDNSVFPASFIIDYARMFRKI